MLVALGLLVACTTTTTGNGRGDDGNTPPPSPSAPGSAAQSPAPLEFNDCSQLLYLGRVSADRRKNLTVECARIQVPVDYARPAGAQISIALLRIHYADQPQRIGSLLVNPGGPGASGVSLAVGLAGELSTDVLRHFDIVGFDPRGVGLSAPVKCMSTAQEDQLLATDTDVRTTAGLRAAKQLYAGFATSCDASYGVTISHYDTVDTARDMDRIRAALGDATTNYLGFSYGTQLGAVYAHLFPKTIRVAALDGAVDPNSDDVLSQTSTQVAGFEQAFDQFAAYCVTQDRCRQLGDPRQAVYAIRDKAATSPIPSSDTHDQRRATASLVLLGVLQALYKRDDWPTTTPTGTIPVSTRTLSMCTSRSPATTRRPTRTTRRSRQRGARGRRSTRCSVCGRPPPSLNAMAGRNSGPRSRRRPRPAARRSWWSETCTIPPPHMPAR